MWSFVKRHWKGAASFGCGVATVALAPISVPVAIGVAAACSILGLAAGKAYEAGKAVGGAVNSLKKGEK